MCGHITRFGVARRAAPHAADDDDRAAGLQLTAAGGLAGDEVCNHGTEQHTHELRGGTLLEPATRARLLPRWAAAPQRSQLWSRECTTAFGRRSKHNAQGGVDRSNASIAAHTLLQSLRQLLLYRPVFCVLGSMRTGAATAVLHNRANSWTRHRHSHR